MSLEDSGQKSMLLLSTEYKGPLVNDAIYNGSVCIDPLLPFVSENKMQRV